MNDLAMPHPTRPGLWKIVGRADEQIVLSNGEKTNPVPLGESLILVVLWLLGDPKIAHHDRNRDDDQRRSTRPFLYHIRAREVPEWRPG